MSKYLFYLFLIFLLFLPALSFAYDDANLSDDEAGVIFLNHYSFDDGGSLGRAIISYLDGKEFAFIGTVHFGEGVFYKVKAGEHEFLSYSSSNNGSLLKVKLEKKKYYYFIVSRNENGDKGFKLIKNKEDFEKYVSSCKDIIFPAPKQKDYVKYNKDSWQEKFNDLYSSLKRLNFLVKVPDNYGVDNWKCY